MKDPRFNNRCAFAIRRIESKVDRILSWIQSFSHKQDEPIKEIERCARSLRESAKRENRAVRNNLESHGHES